jgi:hypothetical protein
MVAHDQSDFDGHDKWLFYQDFLVHISIVLSIKNYLPTACLPTLPDTKVALHQPTFRGHEYRTINATDDLSST